MGKDLYNIKGSEFISVKTIEELPRKKGQYRVIKRGQDGTSFMNYDPNDKIIKREFIKKVQEWYKEIKLKS